MSLSGSGPVFRFISFHRLALGITLWLFLATSTVARADYIYTFERTGTNAYSFSFFEPTLLVTNTPNLNIGTVTAGIYTFQDSALAVIGSTFCFAFGSGSTDAFENVGVGCGLQHSPVSGVTALFSGSNHVGTFNVIPGTSFSYPNNGREITRLTITAVPEPSSLALLASGAMVFVRRWRRR
jgi:hypothetical protein